MGPAGQAELLQLEHGIAQDALGGLLEAEEGLVEGLGGRSMSSSTRLVLIAAARRWAVVARRSVPARNSARWGRATDGSRLDSTQRRKSIARRWSSAAKA
jgi:hypothetical protein